MLKIPSTGNNTIRQLSGHKTDQQSKMNMAAQVAGKLKMVTCAINSSPTNMDVLPP